MENQNPDANQLPEVDSLPDGFVDSSREPLASSAPNFELEKPDCPNFGNGKENISEIDCPSEHVHGVSTNEFVKSHNETENTPELKIFPVSFSEKDNFDGSEGLVEMLIKGHVDQAEGMLVTPVSGDSVSEASVRVSECCEVKERAEVKCQHSERLIEEGSGAQTTNMKESSFLEGTDEMKNGKNETAEIKHKNVKRTFKSEKEFLEFTLKYRQVIAERDSDKLESLCRELQRQNKVLMDECKRVSTEGQTFRLDLSARFQDAIKDVSYKLEEQKNECISQLKENEMLRSKLKELADQYALSEQQFAQKVNYAQYSHSSVEADLELQIAHLKIKQHEEKLVQEQSQMKLYAEQVLQLLQTEKNLRLQLTADGEKFQQFQEALAKSNEVFETFKQEIEKMTKSMKELKKENLFLKSKTENSDVTLILIDERERLKKQLEKTNNQKEKEKLESSCRSLQAERKQNSAGSNNSESGMNA